MNNLRSLPHAEGKQVLFQYDFDWYSKVTYHGLTLVYFIRDGDTFKPYLVERYDSYITQAVERLESFKVDRDKLTYELAVRFREAIRENSGHQLGFSYYACRNVEQVERFIKRVWDKELANRKRFLGPDPV